MAMKKMMVDGTPVVAFRCTRLDYPQYIERYLKLSGVKVECATKEEFLRYKRTRKNRLSVQEQLNQIEMW